MPQLLCLIVTLIPMKRERISIDDGIARGLTQYTVERATNRTAKSYNYFAFFSLFFT